MCAALTSCQTAPKTGSGSVSEGSVTDNVAAIQTDSNSFSETETLPSEEFTLIQVELPTLVDDSRSKIVEDFDYGEIVQNPPEEGCVPIAMDHDDIVICKDTSNRTDNALLEFYKYNIKSKTLTKLSGNVPRFNVSVETYALVNDKIESVCESNLDERFHYSVDLKDNSVNLRKTETVDPSKESFYFTYALDENSYIEKWFELGWKAANQVNVHVIRYDSNGAEEIISEKGSTTYAVSNNKIYELTYDLQQQKAYVNIKDAYGNPESTLYLPEVYDAIKVIQKDYLSITDFSVLGDHMAVNIRDEYKSSETCFLYNIKNKTVVLIQDCRFLHPAQPTNSEMKNWYFFSLDNCNLYSLDRTGNITLIADNLRRCGFYITDGRNAAYMNENKLYIVEPE